MSEFAEQVIRTSLSVKTSPYIKARISAHISRNNSIKEAIVDESGHLIFVLYDGTELDIGKITGEDGVGIVSIEIEEV